LFDNQQILAFIILDIIKIPLKKGRSTKLLLEKKEKSALLIPMKICLEKTMHCLPS